MQGDPNRSQEILSTDKHYYADVFSGVGLNREIFRRYSSGLLQRLPDVKSCFCP